MIESYDFLKSVLDTITENIVVIDHEGEILFVNKTWRMFGQDNAGLIGEHWGGVNYLGECDKAANMGDDFGAKAADGIRSVIEGHKEGFYFEYPCHSPDEQRWFMMHVTSFTIPQGSHYVISHQNITQRKLAEEEALNLSRIDVLTDIPNRRHFDELLDAEWRRCHRRGEPISLAIIDLDSFKLLNDTYGHQAGDECLRTVGSVLKRFGRRPDDICARYGGEEFAIVYGDTGFDKAKVLVDELLNKIRSLDIPNERSLTLPKLTASIGLATMRPTDSNSASDLIREADELLYLAKENGRNQVAYSSDTEA